jgi:nucleoside-diphosphate kinase
MVLDLKMTALNDLLNAPGAGANLQLTFGMIKSKAVAQGHVGAIFERILDERIIILAAHRAVLNGSIIAQLYGAHFKKSYWPQILDSVSGEVVPMILMGHGVIQHWRDLLGATDSKLAASGTLRNLYGNREVVADNVAHGSDSTSAAQREINIFFEGFKPTARFG